MIACPGCGGNLKFDIGSQLLHCAYCDNSYDPYDFDSKTQDGREVKDYETVVYTCPECAGEIESTEEEVTGFCPFCGASTIFYSRLSKELKPDFLIPFKKTKQDCKDAYMSRARKALFLPKAYKSPEYIDGFRGIYMPYWSYDVYQRGGINAQGEKSYRRGDYIIHEHYRLNGDIDAFYNGLSYDASSSFSDDISERIAPFDVKEKKSFTAGFLSGFYADTADVDASVYSSEATEFAKDNALSLIDKEKEFAGIKIDKKKSSVPTAISKTNRTMFPVWFLSYRNKDRVAYITVNGQTGKVAADLPIDTTKFFIFAGALAAVIFLLLNFVLTLKPAAVSGLTIGMGILSLILYISERSKIRNRENGDNDKGAQNKGNKKKVPMVKGFKETFPIICSLVGIALPLIAIASKSISDVFHYSCSFIGAAAIGVSLVFLIKDYNLLITRRLPQFDKKGGDDNA